MQNNVSKPPIIAHVDRLVLGVDVTRENAAWLTERFEEFRRNMARRFAGKPNVPMRQCGKRRQTPRYIFMSEFSKLTLTPHPQLQPFVRENLRFPSWHELYEMGFKGDWLGYVQITDRRKWNYMAHTENLYLGIEIVEQALEVEPLILEIALDTQNQEYGVYLRKYACLSRPPAITSIFHFKNRCKTKIDGPSPDGCNEYHGYRQKGWSDCRPASERPEGGRRQLHSYDREAYISARRKYSFPRLELRFFRAFLRDYLEPQPINSCVELIQRLPELVGRHLRFRSIDVERLHIERLESRFWSLANLSTKGQIYKMTMGGMEPEDISRYVEQLDPPPILFITEPFPDYDVHEDDGMTLFGDVEYLQKVTESASTTQFGIRET